ncbi:MAG: cell division protein FtsZ [Bacteroidota bacterium]
MIHFDMPPQKSNIIKVLGFGGGGGNAVNHMYLQNIQNVDFIVCNTDAQALTQSNVPNKIQLGPHLTQGLGAGANPNIGRQACEESLEEIRRMMEVNTRMAFITAGMGGGTGTGGAPIVAKICKELGILTVGIVTTPFAFEGPKRMAQAQLGINELKEHVDTLLVISNDKLRQQYGNLKMKDAFSKADDVLSIAARCITDVINTTGQINVDFADVCTVMRDGGVAILGSSQMAGEDRAIKAIEAAINSPLLNDNDIAGAKWILLNITSSEGDFEFTMDEVEMIQNYVRTQTGDNTDVILGMGYDESLGDKLGITIIATGFRHKDPFTKPEPKKAAVVQEAPIIMTLGVAGEEQKMYAKPVAEKKEVIAPLMPTINQQAEEEMDAPEIISQPVSVEPVLFDPVASSLADAEEDNEQPIIFELSIDAPEAPEAAASPVNAFNEPKSEDLQAGLNEPVKMSPEHPMFAGSFLSKPSQIYSTSNINPAAIKQEEKPEPPVSVIMPKQEEEAINAITLSEEALNPVLNQQLPAEEEEIMGMTLSYEEPVQQPKVQATLFNERVVDNGGDLSEEEEQKKRAQERINRLRNLSFNPLHIDNSSEFENVPAYMRRNMELHNSIANVEDFYSRAQVKSDDNNQASISTLNNFLHGEKPD